MVGVDSIGSTVGSPLSVFEFPKSQDTLLGLPPPVYVKLTMSGEQPELTSTVNPSCPSRVEENKMNTAIN